MKRMLLLNGPNLNLLGTREPDVYGHDTLASIEEEVAAYGASKGVAVDCFQSNHEGVLIDRLHEARPCYDGIVYNPGAHTHYSYALRDAVASIGLPVVEVHLSDIEAREPFRALSVIAPVCVAQIKGKGKAGYKEAIDVLLGYADRTAS
ncbi:MAG: type II 3-dehydroquinate dehydratase [Eggerthellaceae bacterium]|nr:type II 3-dehydroquinate dehydratase [Eggerthellaceae bacterium]